MISGLDHVNFSVDNLEKSIEWYSRVLGFKVVEKKRQKDADFAVLRIENAMLCIYEYDKKRQLVDRYDLAKRGMHGFNHLCMRINNKEAWLTKLEEENIPLAYGGIIEWPHSLSWYIKDPTGYEIEICLWNDDTINFSD